MMPIVFFLMRAAIFIALSYLVYVIFYKPLRKSAKEKPNKKTTAFACPSPKTFIDYTEGRIKGEKKKAINEHIAHCKNCQEALKDVFDMPAEEGLKRK